MTFMNIAIVVVVLTILLVGVIFGYTMVSDYRRFLDDHRNVTCGFADFLRREQFYIYIYLAFVFLMLVSMLIYLSID